MRWQIYRDMYHTYNLSVSQTRVLTILAEEVVKEFPKRLPEHLRGPLRRNLEELGRAFKAVRTSQIRGEPAPERVEIKLEDLDQGEYRDDLLFSVLTMYGALAELGASSPDVDFERLLYSQELVMLLAHLDAFMADSLRVICEVRPEVLRSSKQMGWDTILSLGGWYELLDYLIEEYVYEFGWKSFPKRVEFLRERLGLSIECPECDLELLEKAENIRHIVVHNGGRVSQEYIARTGRNDLVIGESVPVTLEYVDDVAAATRLLASDLFLGVSKKFFGMEDSAITIMFPRGFTSEDNGT